MSKEFEEWRRKVGVESNEFTMRNCFEAGRALGRREMKGEAQAELLHYHDDKNCGCDRSVNYVCDVCVALDACADAIEAIPEEV